MARILLQCEPMGTRSQSLCQCVPSLAFGPAFVVSAVLFTMGTWTAAADACSYLPPPPQLYGYPKDGDTQVPTDVVPFYDTVQAGIYRTPVVGGHSSPSGSEFSLRSSTGTVVEFAALTTYYGSIELRPQAELAPNTTYTLEATLPVVQAQPVVRSVTFTTGNQRAAAPLPPEGAFIQHYRFHGESNSCSPEETSSCVAFAQGPVVANFVDEFGQEHGSYLWQQPVLMNLSGINQGTNFRCVKLQSRAPDGELSSPISLCTTDGPLLELTGSSQIGCSAAGLTQAGVLATESNSDSGASCALAPPSFRGFGWFGLSLAIAIGSVFAKRRAGAKGARRKAGDSLLVRDRSSAPEGRP